MYTKIPVTVWLFGFSERPNFIIKFTPYTGFIDHQTLLIMYAVLLEHFTTNFCLFEWLVLSEHNWGCEYV